MTSAQIRQSYLDFFKSKGHTIVPSSSLMPDSPNLLFTNAGMNQFVPIFLGQRPADVNQWPGSVPALATRATDTQKCIRAGGKHNDLEDVGLDTYHHTFFEMLGNWSFGDYFKKEAIEWAWELVAEVWKFPKNRLYATVYKPGPGDPSHLDQEAWDHWARLFTAAGLDPKVHIVYGNKKDNFWMMGDTGPCGPCSEIHVDLTPAGDIRGALVNKGDARCIEIWNLVFIQFNANPDGTFSPLPAQHVDTGMGFERVTGIIQNTKGFTDFGRVISNYETDIFRPIFDKLEELSGKKYGSTLPKAGASAQSEQEKIDIAFRVVADHIRTLSFSIADGIQPANTDRNYVLRRILRRAVRYGRTLGFHEPFFYMLVDVLAETMGGVFPEIRTKQKQVQDVIRMEEEVFNRTLDRGVDLFNVDCALLIYGVLPKEAGADIHKMGEGEIRRELEFVVGDKPGASNWDTLKAYAKSKMPTFELSLLPPFSAKAAFQLYDTYGFPLDLTELMARERGMTVDTAGFEKLMEEQRDRARKAQKKQVISLSNIDTSKPTRFAGFDQFTISAKVKDVVEIKDKTGVVLEATPFYAEMGGQVGDTGTLQGAGGVWHVVNTQKAGNTFVHLLAEKDAPADGTTVELQVDVPRRNAIQRHHTVTHLLHWALHEVVNHEATQKGSYVGPDKLTFDFSSAALTTQQVSDVEKLVNDRILENGVVSWKEVPYAEVKGRKEIMQFFGEKYGDLVRVVQIGGRAGELDGFSMELCGGTHTRAAGEIGLFRILSEGAVAAGIRRFEAVAGLRAYDKTKEDAALIASVAGKVNSPVIELEKKIESLLAHQKELEKKLKGVQQKQAVETARSLVANAFETAPAGKSPLRAIVENLGEAEGDYIQSVADALKGQFKGVILLAGAANEAVSLVAAVSSEVTSRIQAGKLIQAVAPIVGGKGGGRPDNARGGGREVAKIEAALDKARELIRAA